MNRLLLMLSLLYPISIIFGDEKISNLSSKAEALSEAHDDEAAMQIYEKLSKQSLPDWQKSRLFYNMGTIRLVQQKPDEALAIFQGIHPTALSLPHFGRNLLLNEGIAYLHYAQLTALDRLSSLNLQALFIKQALTTFDQAQNLECREELIESIPSCQSSILLNEWVQATRIQLHHIYELKRKEWMENATVPRLASLLNISMQKLLDSMEMKGQKSSSSFIPYFQFQGQSLLPLWNFLEQKELKKRDKEVFEESVKAYSEALKYIGKNDFASALEQWKLSIKKLNLLTFQENREFQYAKLNYEIILLQENLSALQINDLIREFEALKIENEQITPLDKIKISLNESLKAIQAKKIEQARFYLVAGFGQLAALFKDKQSSPAAVLTKALELIKDSMQLFFLAQFIPQEAIEQAQIILKDQGSYIFIEADSFIPAVLKRQNDLFHQSKDLDARCQETPWDQVIPLFDRGFRLEKSNQQLMSKAPFDFEALISNQAEAIKDWKEALYLILHPPKQQSAESQPQKWAETFRQIQEMYLEDQSKPEQVSKELHAW